MSNARAFDSQPRTGRPNRAMTPAHGLALNALFPPPPRLPEDMLAALARLDRRSR